MNHELDLTTMKRVREEAQFYRDRISAILTLLSLPQTPSRVTSSAILTPRLTSLQAKLDKLHSDYPEYLS